MEPHCCQLTTSDSAFEFEFAIIRIPKGFLIWLLIIHNLLNPVRPRLLLLINLSTFLEKVTHAHLRRINVVKKKNSSNRKMYVIHGGITCCPDPQSLGPSLQQPLLPDLDLLPEIVPDIYAHRCVYINV